MTSPRLSRVNEKATQIYRVGGDYAFRALIHSASRVGSFLPVARPAFHGVKRIANVPYRDSGSADHLLDIYIPSHAKEPMPVAIYIHGGGFRFCSKDTHWVMALGFARQGFAVFSINYRLAPPHRFPAGLEDCCAALKWVAEHAGEYGGDPKRLVLAGESAGANLASCLAILTSYPRREPWAREVWDSGIRPAAVAALCGILQVTNPERISRRKKLARWVWHRISEPSLDYVPVNPDVDPALTDPLVFLEKGKKPRRKLPPFLVSVGTRDPLLDDSRRLARALKNLGVPCEDHYYKGAVHAFQALVWDPRSWRYWNTQFDFLNQYVGPLTRKSGQVGSLKALWRQTRDEPTNGNL